MEKGYILVNVPESCENCNFYDWGFCQATRNDENEDGKYIHFKDVKDNKDNKPSWCPIHTWISVTEKKPSNKDEVYVTLRDGSRDICWYAKEFDEWYDGQYNKKDVVKWIPFDIEQFKEK